jgi:hypothetical protein
MTSALWFAVLGLVLIFLVAGWYLSYTAARLDRLHAKVSGAWHTVETQLVRRAEAIVELANSGQLDAASAFLLVSAAADVLEMDEDDQRKRISAENDLSAATTTVLAQISFDGNDSSDAEWLNLLVRTDRRVQLAATFYNDAVVEVMRVRRKLLIRAFRLAGHAPLPTFIQLDECALPGSVMPA